MYSKMFSVSIFLDLMIYYIFNDFFQIKVMKYFFSRHIDGHDILVRWRLVIHGAIDGYSQIITYLQWKNINVLQIMLKCLN